MVISAWKIFSTLFPFLHEIFIAKKGAKKKKPTGFFHKEWVKKVIVGIGLLCAIGLFYTTEELIRLKREMAVLHSKPNPTTPAIIAQRTETPVEPNPPIPTCGASAVVYTPITPTSGVKKKQPASVGKSHHEQDEVHVKLLEINQIGS